jgi:ferredoxin
MAQLEYLKNVVTLQLNEGKCIACGMCMQVCPHAVLRLNGVGRVEIQNRDACMECGACSRNCPTEALSVISGVGCAAAVINTMLGRDSTACCCTIDSEEATNNKGRARCC